MKQWDFCLLGRLASNTEVEMELGKPKSVFVNKQNVVQFVIKMISKPPESFPNQHVFTCYGTDLEKFGYEDDTVQPDYVREDKLRDFLDDYLLVFLPARRTIAGQDMYLANQVSLLRKADTFQNDTYVPVPLYSREKHGYPFADLCSKLLHKKHIGKIEKYSTDVRDTPKCLVWKENESEYYAVGEFSGHSYAYGGFRFSSAEEVKAYPMSDVWLDDMYEVYDCIAFISVPQYESMMDLLWTEEVQPISAIACSDGVYEAAASILESAQAIVNCEEEAQFIEHFIHVTRASGLLYAEKDLVNFHIAMKVSNLVILQGMSGIGKSRLVHAYAKALGIHNDEQLLVTPVRPSWKDDYDVIGYADVVNMTYRPGDSGIIDMLHSASKEENKEKLYIIAFDEMNLARVEHYFSQFLAVLEMEGSERKLRLYSDNLEGQLHNGTEYPPVVPIGRNVMFVGTVNVDESTHHFSDKVLDRANVITLDVLKYSLFTELEEKIEYEERKVSFSAYESFRNVHPALQLSEQELEMLWDIHEAMRQADAKAGIGPRVVRQIDAYLKNVPDNVYLHRGDALDLQLVQRVLTKVRGSEDAWKLFIGTYEQEQQDVYSSQLLDTLARYEGLSSFRKTIETVKQKAKELKYHGYTY